MNAYWYITALHDIENVIDTAVRSNDIQQAVAVIALVVDNDVECAAIVSVLGPVWHVQVMPDNNVLFCGQEAPTVNLTELRHTKGLTHGRLEFGGEKSQYPSLFNDIFGWYDSNGLTVPYGGVSPAVSLSRLWSGASVLHLQPPGIDVPAVRAAIRGINKATRHVTLRPTADGTALQEFTYPIGREPVVRDYPVLTIHQLQLISFVQSFGLANVNM